MDVTYVQEARLVLWALRFIRSGQLVKVGAFGWWRWCIVGLFNVRVLDKGKEDQLRGVSHDRDEQHFIACRHQGDSIVSGIAD